MWLPEILAAEIPEILAGARPAGPLGSCLVITPHNYQRLHGEENPILTGDISGLIATDQITVNYSTTADKTSAVGAYPISIAIEDLLARLNNYAVSVNAGVMEVVQQGGTSSGGKRLGTSREGGFAPW